MKIGILGVLRLTLPGGAVLNDLGPQSGALLGRLALDPSRAFSREELIDFLWPDTDDVEEGRRRLRQLVFGIRRAVEDAGCDGSGPFRSTRAILQLDPDTVEVDAAEFLGLIRAARQSAIACERAEYYERAVQLYRGELMAGFYQDVFVAMRDHYAAECYEALRGLARAREELGQLEGAVEAARRAVTVNPTGEEAYCDLMRHHAAMGEPSAVLRRYREMERILREELDVQPSPAARELLTELRSVEPPARPGPEAGKSPAGNTETDSAPPLHPVAHRPERLRRRRRGRNFTAGGGALVAITLALVVMGIFLPRASSKNPPAAASGYFKDTQPLWVTRYVKRPGDSDSESEAVTVDSSGSSYVAGLIRTKKRDVDFLVLKYDPEGRQVWEYRYNGPGNDVDRAHCIARDQEGNVYLAGDSDNGKGDGTWTRLAGLDFAIIKLGPNGKPSPTWPDVGYGPGVRRYNGPDNGEDWPKELLLDNAGGVYVMGYSYSRKGGRDWVVVKYEASTGRRLWTTRYDGDAHDEDQPGDMLLSADGQLYVTGGSRLGRMEEPESDVVTIQYRQDDGREVWRRRWGQGNHADDFGAFVRTHTGGNICVLAMGRTGPGTFNHDRTGCISLLYDSSGKLHRARGADSARDQIDTLRGVEGWGFIFGEYGRKNRILLRDESGGVVWVRDYRSAGGPNNHLFDSATVTNRFIYLMGFLTDSGDGREVRAADYATIAFDLEGNIHREWFYRGTGQAGGLDRAKALAVHNLNQGSPNEREYVIVTGQSWAAGSNDLVTLCYRSF